MLNALTVDLEDWFQSSLELFNSSIISGTKDIVYPSGRVVGNTEKLLSIFAECNVKATFFVLGTVAEKFSSLIRQVYEEGHEVATHGYSHTLIYKQNPQTFSSELRKSVFLIEEITGQKLIGHRAPYGSITRSSLWALDILIENGIEYDSSISPTRRTRCGISDAPQCLHRIITTNGNGITEIPFSTMRFLSQNIPVAGGSYFRLLPYSFTKRAIKIINEEGNPAIVYLHPYELDTEELAYPVGGNGWRARYVRFSQNLNRPKTEGKLRALLTDFQFAPLRDLLESGVVSRTVTIGRQNMHYSENGRKLYSEADEID